MVERLIYQIVYVVYRFIFITNHNIRAFYI
jgi:hypothetical protein